MYLVSQEGGAAILCSLKIVQRDVVYVYNQSKIFWKERRACGKYT